MRKVYNKLVRDKMIDVYTHDVAHAISATDFKVKKLSTEEILLALKTKLEEEVSELQKAETSADVAEEIVDVLEVIEAISEYYAISHDHILKIKQAKKDARGAFKEGLFLEYIDFIQ
jgi:predicted house-cleaning noncanonical NTP pyrophosphatase (MazG superfamily)